MSVLTRTNYIPNTLIASAPVNTDFNQLVDLLSGVSTTKDALIKFNHATDPVLRVDQLGAGAVQQWLQNGVVRASLSGLGKLLLPAGIGTTPSADTISNFGNYFADSVTRDTPANTNETDLSSKTVSANVLANDGDYFILLSNILYNNTANTKRYRLYFAGTVIYDTGAVVFNNVNHFLIGFFMRKSSSNLTGIFNSMTTGVGAASGATFFSLGGLDFTVGNILKSTGQNGTAAAADISQRAFLVIKGSV